MGTKRTTLDAFKGTRSELLALLRDLHNGTQEVDGLTRLQALDVVCDVLSDPSRDVESVVLAGRITARLVGAILRENAADARAVGGVS